MKVLFSRDKAEEEQARLTKRKRSEMGRWRLLYRIVLPPLAGESGASAMQCTASPNRIISDQLVFVFEMRLEAERWTPGTGPIQRPNAMELYYGLDSGPDSESTRLAMHKTDAILLLAIWQATRQANQRRKHAVS
jgi:hypothetical protein